MQARRGKHVIVGSDGAAFATARAAAERGYEPIVLVPRGVPSVRLMPGDIRACDLDSRDKAGLRHIFAGASMVYYCCGTAIPPIDEDEPQRLAQIVEAASETGASFIYCDAPYAYGAAGRALSEEMPQRARDPLGSFLGALAQFVIQSHRSGRIVAVIARHADLIGPEIVRSPFGEAFIRSVLNGRAISVLGRRSGARSLTYGADLGRALVLLSEQHDTWGQIWHVPSSAPIAPAKLIAAIRMAAGLDAFPPKAIHEIRSAGPLLGGKRDKAQRGLARDYESRFALSSAKFERAFGMHATALNDVIVETVEAVKRA